MVGGYHVLVENVIVSSPLQNPTSLHIVPLVLHAGVLICGQPVSSQNITSLDIDTSDLEA